MFGTTLSNASKGDVSFTIESTLADFLDDMALVSETDEQVM
jgi:hypothetical protein